MFDIPALARLIRHQRELAADVIERLRLEVVKQTLAECDDNYSEAGRRLGFPRRTLCRLVPPKKP